MLQFLSSQVISDLQARFPSQVSVDVPLSDCSRWRVGGVAKCVIFPSSEDEFIECIQFCLSSNVRYVVLGATSNLLFSDKGLGVLGISLSRLKGVKISDSRVVAQAGIWVPHFARRLALEGLSGLEHIVGIPGSLGGLIYMNGGSQRKGIGSHVVFVKTLNSAGEMVVYRKEDCGFSYRHSEFQHRKEIILEAEFQLTPSSKRNIKLEMLNILRGRRKKFPLKLPNCGSVFVSNPAMYEEYGPPGAVIERCNLKGVVVGRAQVSPEHANFIVNLGGATANDILKLIKLVQSKVFEMTGYKMVSEVRYMADDGVALPAASVEISC